MMPFVPPEASGGPRSPSPLIPPVRLGASLVQPKAGTWRAHELVKQKTNELPYQERRLQMGTDQGLTSAQFPQLQVLLPEQPVLFAKRPKFGLRFNPSLDHFLFRQKEGSENAHPEVQDKEISGTYGNKFLKRRHLIVILWLIVKLALISRGPDQDVRLGHLAGGSSGHHQSPGRPRGRRPQ